MTAAMNAPMNANAEMKEILRQMLAVMEAERQALAALDIDGIMGCSSDKTSLCDKLSKASNDNLDEECLGLIDSMRRLNEVNRQVRNLIAANVSARLDTLTGAAPIYKAQGVRAGYSRYGAAPHV